MPQPARRFRPRAALPALAALCLALLMAATAPAVLAEEESAFRLTSRARDQLSGGRPEEALASLLKSQALDPRNDWTQSLLGRTYLALGRPREAALAFLAAQRLNPGDAASRLALSRLLDGPLPGAIRLAPEAPASLARAADAEAARANATLSAPALPGPFPVLALDPVGGDESFALARALQGAVSRRGVTVLLTRNSPQDPSPTDRFALARLALARLQLCLFAGEPGGGGGNHTAGQGAVVLVIAPAASPEASPLPARAAALLAALSLPSAPGGPPGLWTHLLASRRAAALHPLAQNLAGLPGEAAAPILAPALAAAPVPVLVLAAQGEPGALAARLAPALAAAVLAGGAGQADESAP